MNRRRNSIANIGLSLLLCAIGFNGLSQYKTKKYIRKNKGPEIVDCDNEKIYARGLLSEGSKIFTGNSDGSLYYFNLEKESVNLIFKMDNIEEMRDVERVDDQVIAMLSGDDSHVVKIDNYGNTEMIQSDLFKGVFLDGMDFEGRRGFLMGDPNDSIFRLFISDDYGTTWTACKSSPTPEKGEAGFAASGTNVQVLNDSTYVFVSGGEKSRFFKTNDRGDSWKEVALPYYPGESSGAFSMHFSTDSVGVIVGGDYLQSDLKLNTTYYTTDGGESWFNSENPPRGYRSCVYEVDGIYYCCGRNGIDFSSDGGKNWTPFANGVFFSLGNTEEKLIATSKEGKLYLFNLLVLKD